MDILKEKKHDCRVSSVLNRNNKENGKKYMFDNSDETCWSSDAGLPQFVTLDFETPVEVKAVKIQFQGGFAGRDCTITLNKWAGDEVREEFYPEDVNKAQVFALKDTVDNVKNVRLVFDSSYDFFGRIIIYNLQVLR